MPTIRTRKTKGGEIRYEVSVRLAGAPSQLATFSSLKKAKQWGQEREVEIREQRQFGRSLSSKRTLADAVDRFVAEYMERLAVSGRRNRTLHLQFWRQRLGHVRLISLTPDHFAKASAELEAGGTGPATVNRYLAAVARVMSLAEKEWRWLDRNPLRGVARRKESGGRVRFLSDAERERLLAACRESRNEELYPLVLLALGTGGRFGELTGLRWEEIDFERGALTFHRTKNSERRSVPITQPVREALAIRVPKESGPVFVRRSHRTAWENALERSGVADFRFHDLRHSAASYLAMSGASLLEIAALLGHKTLTMVRRYAHLSTAHLTEVSNRMASKFLTQPGPGDPPASD